jgi:hypothetical protein
LIRGGDSVAHIEDVSNSGHNDIARAQYLSTSLGGLDEARHLWFRVGGACVQNETQDEEYEEMHVFPPGMHGVNNFLIIYYSLILFKQCVQDHARRCRRVVMMTTDE